MAQNPYKLSKLNTTFHGFFFFRSYMNGFSVGQKNKFLTRPSPLLDLEITQSSVYHSLID